MRTKKQVLKIGIIVVVLISFGILIRSTDFQKVIASIRLIGIRFIFILLSTFIAYLLATIGWKYCFKKDIRNLAINDLFLIRHIGETVSLINPASILGGEAMKIYMLRNKGLQQADIVASVLISRVMMAITQVVIFISSLAIVYSSDTGLFDSFPHIGLKPAAALLSLTIMIAFFTRNHIYMRQIYKTSKLYSLIHRLAYKWKIKEVLLAMNHFFRHDVKGLLFCTLLFLMHWVIGSMEIYFILLFLGIKASIFQVILVDMGIVLFKAAGAFVPGQIGVEEMGNKIMLGFIGIPDYDIWITISILRRTRQLFWIVVGVTAYMIYNKKVSNLPDLS